MKDIELERLGERAQLLTLHGQNELSFYDGHLVGVTVAGSKFRLRTDDRERKRHLIETAYNNASEVNDVALQRYAYKAMNRGRDFHNNQRH